jgi:gliding motility-associated-like protein
VLENAADGGSYFVGSDPSLSFDGLVVEKLDACGQAGCGSEIVNWATAYPNIPQLTPQLPITATSTNVTPVFPTTFNISSNLLQNAEIIDCDSCGVSLAQGDIIACSGQPIMMEPAVTGMNLGGLNWSWDLGDGSSSSMTGVVEHTYVSTGDHNVLLIVTDSLGGCIDSVMFNVSVVEMIVPELGPDVEICQGEVVVLDPGAAGPASVSWSNGSTDQTLLATVPGAYWVQFQQGLCSASDTVMIHVQSQPEVILESSVAICSGDSVMLEPQPGWTGWNWSTGSTEASIWVSEGGQVTVLADWNGCPAMDTVDVSVIDPPPVDIGPDVIACEGSVVHFTTGLPAYDHLWSDGSAENSLSVTENGVIWVEVGLAGCTAIDSVLVAFVEPPNVLLGQDTLLCNGAVLVLGPASGGQSLWSDGSTGATLTVVSAGTYSVTVTNAGCSVSDAIVISTASNPTVELSSDSTTCGVASIEVIPIVQQGADAFLWSTGVDSPTLTVSSTGSYWLHVSNVCGNASDTILVVMNDIPEVVLGPDLLICGESTVTLSSGHPQLSVMWSSGATSNEIEISVPGEYWVLVNGDGCMGSDTIVVNWSPIPDIQLSGDTVLCQPGAIPIQVTQLEGELLWSTGETTEVIFVDAPAVYVATASNVCGTSTDSVQVIFAASAEGDSLVAICWGEVVPLSLPPGFTDVLWSSGQSEPTIHTPAGEYHWTALDLYGCPRSGRFFVEVDTLKDGLVFVPNVFTPNGDGVNDRFGVVGAETGEFSLTVFNRWGMELWNTVDPRNTWDGTFGGSPVPDGTYVYLLRHQGFCPDKPRYRQRTGHVTLLR